MNSQIPELLRSLDTGIELEALLAFIQVETGGEGFNRDGSLKIQFEPSWFKKLYPKAPANDWSKNRVEGQTAEWKAYNNAAKYSEEYARQATSIGLGQIMGFNYKKCGFKSASAMWEDALLGLSNQIMQMVAFIKSNKKLFDALNNHDWSTCAYYYNGSGYKQLAKKLGITPYDIQLANAYAKYKSIK